MGLELLARAESALSPAHPTTGPQALTARTGGFGLTPMTSFSRIHTRSYSGDEVTVGSPAIGDGRDALEVGRELNPAVAADHQESAS
jgi:hypothetical protein